MLTETPKSLLYRFQYWQATAAMIADHPWFGCGPGNFQHYYTMYKLPEASESIADPHNLLFEVAATAGLPALAAFAAVLALAAGRWLVAFRREAQSCGADSVDSQIRDGRSDRHNPRPVPADKTAAPQTIASGAYVGALIGVGLAWWTGFVFDMQPDVALLVLGVPTAVLLLAAVLPWTARGRMPEPTPWIALVVLTINLLAAGGIGFAGIAPSWWLLLAVAINSTETVSSERRVPRIAVGLLAAGALVLVAACFVTLYTPVLRCRARLDEGLALARLSRFAEAETVFREAAGADPYSVEPWQELTILYHQAALETGSAEALSRFEAALGETLQRNPHAHTLRRLVGDWRLAIFARWADRRNLEEAIDAYSRSVQLYPNHAYGHAQLALAYHLGGDQQSASREATEALRLDDLNPHREKKLSHQRLYDPASKAAEPQENAEQMMRRLRK